VVVEPSAHDELAAWMSHDLRRPIETLKSLLDELVLSQTNAPEIFVAMQSEVRNLDRIIGDIQEVQTEKSSRPGSRTSTQRPNTGDSSFEPAFIETDPPPEAGR